MEFEGRIEEVFGAEAVGFRLDVDSR